MIRVVAPRQVEAVLFLHLISPGAVNVSTSVRCSSNRQFMKQCPLFAFPCAILYFIAFVCCNLAVIRRKEKWSAQKWCHNYLLHVLMIYLVQWAFVYLRQVYCETHITNNLLLQSGNRHCFKLWPPANCGTTRTDGGKNWYVVSCVAFSLSFLAGCCCCCCAVVQALAKSLCRSSQSDTYRSSSAIH